MHYLLPLILLIASYPFSAPAAMAGTASDPVLTEFEAVYEVHRGNFEIAEVRMSLKLTQKGIYRFTSRSEAVGMLAWFMSDVITEESIFRMDGHHFRPVSYEYRHKGSSKNRDESIIYDWTNGVAELDYRGNTSTVELEEGTIDRFLLQLSTAAALDKGADRYAVRVLDNGRVTQFTLQAADEEKIRTPAGSYTTLPVSKSDKDDDKRITFWFAPTLNYVPVRIERVKKNEEPMRMELKRIAFPAGQ